MCRTPAAAWGFAVRALQLAASYRLRLALAIAGLAASVAVFACVGRVVALAGPGFRERYGMSYAAFAVVGVVLHGVASSGLASFRAAARREQMLGTLESVATVVSVPLAVALSGAAELLLAAFGAAITLGGAAWALGLRLAPEPAALAGAALYVIGMCGLGLASGGTILVSKEGDPIAWVVSTLAALGGGVYFPVELLPVWARRVSTVLPTTHALALVRSSCGTRDVVVAGDVVRCAGSVTQVDPAASLAALAAFSAGSLVVGFLVLRWGAGRAVRDGTLGEH